MLDEEVPGQKLESWDWRYYAEKVKRAKYAFDEQDRPILEAQQRAYDLAGGPDSLRPVMLSIDAAPLRARRVLAQLIAAEAQQDIGRDTGEDAARADVDAGEQVFVTIH